MANQRSLLTRCNLASKRRSISSPWRSVEDDAFGDDLQVIWELDPGIRMHEKIALPKPTGFDALRRLAAFLDAVCWGAVTDDYVALISSAKLTDCALNLNMELGVLIRGSDLPSQIANYLRRLTEEGVFVRLQS